MKKSPEIRNVCKSRGNNIVTHIERAAAQAVGPFKIPIGRKPQREKLRMASEYHMHTICMRYAYDMRGKGGEEAAVATFGWVQAPLELCHDMRIELTWWEKLTMRKGMIF